MPKPFRFLCIGLGAVMVLALTVRAVDADRPAVTDESRRQTELQAKIDQLIEQLGHKNYATRERAQAELGQMGLAAYDDLYRAQDHSDHEIARRASFLLRSMRIRFVRDGDPPQVKRALENYGSFNADVRALRIEQLGQLGDGIGVDALCRLVKFEKSLRLAKLAAVQILKQPPPQTRHEIAQLVVTIRTGVGRSQRAAIQWLRVHARSLENPKTPASAWDDIVRKENDAYGLLVMGLSDEPKVPELVLKQSSRGILRDLVDFHANRLLRQGRLDEASAVMARWPEMGDRSRFEMLETTDWFTKHNEWAATEKLAQRHNDLFKGDAELLYVLANAQLQLKKDDQAKATAARALAIVPEDLAAHLQLVSALETRGLKTWAESECRYVIEKSAPGSAESVGAHIFLPQMLHDAERYLAAATLRKTLVELMEKDSAVAQIVLRQWATNPKTIRAQMHFEYALHWKSIGEHKKQIEALDEAVGADPADVDVLIALYQLPGQDDAHRERTKELIKTAAAGVRERIGQYERYQKSATSLRNPEQKQLITRFLGSRYNELAWLLGNTIGDYDEAIRLSEKSLQLRPNTGGFFDTLAHCYYTKGDYANAVKNQRKAIELDPHSGVIARQLKVFEEALAKSQEKQQ